MANDARYTTTRELISSLFRMPETIVTVLYAVGAAGGAVTAGDLFAHVVAAKPPLDAFRAYLWVSGLAVALLFVGWATLAKKLYSDFSNQTRQLATRDDGIRLQHEMAEIVRACVDAQKRKLTIELQSRLNRIGVLIKQYLAHRLPERKFFVTVKILSGDQRLKAVFRDSEQDRGARKPGDDIATEDSCIYTRFKHDAGAPHAGPPQKQVLVRDVEDLDKRDEGFQKRARDCGFATVLGFPLRNPGQLEDGTALAPLKCASLLGFLSIDSPTVGAFDDLFKKGAAGRSGRKNDGSDLIPLDDMNLFYGVADSIATIVVLLGHPAKS